VKMPPQNLFEKMNKTERHRAIQLEAMKRDGQIRDWGFEAMSLKLGAGAYYTPDFMVIENDGTLRFEETKGHWREAARVRIKVAASLFHCQFTAMRLVKGAWEEEEF
jgi:hypothetical protein